MSNRATQLLAAATIAITLATVPTVVARHILTEFALHHGRAELTAAADRQVARMEAILTDVLERLRHLRMDGRPACRELNLLNAGSAEGPRFGLLDADGRLLCARPQFSTGLLRHMVRYRGNIAVAPKSPLPGESRALVASLPAGEGARLFAVIGSAVMMGDFAPVYARKHLSMMVRVGSQDIPIGQSPPEDPVTPIAVTARSQRVPLAASLVVPRAALLEWVAPLFTLIWYAGGLGLALFGLLAFLVTRRTREEVKLEAAIRERRVVPYYQPIVNLKTGRLVGCEVLARLKRLDGSLVPPAAFIAEAEETGLIFELTRQIMGRAAKDLASMLAADPEMTLSFNLSAGHFADQRIVEDIRLAFRATPIALRQLMFEITEHRPLADMDQARRTITEIRALGARVALDDAGAGHGGLAALRQLGIDVLKIDRQFVGALEADGPSRAIVETLIHLAGNLGMEVIAEGVETSDQAADLCAMGVALAQGYLIAPPLPVRHFARFAGARCDDRAGIQDRPVDLAGALA